MLEGEGRLMLAVFLRAIKDALCDAPKSYRANGLYPDRMEDIREARYWLFWEPLTQRYPMSFASVCRALDWEPSRIRADLNRFWLNDRARLRRIVEQFDPENETYAQKAPCPKQQAQSFSQQLTFF